MSSKTLWITDTAGEPIKLTCSIDKRQLKNRVVYDARSRIFDGAKGYTQKKWCGYESEKLAFKAFTRFAMTYRPPHSRTQDFKEEARFAGTLENYFSYIRTENAESTIFDKEITLRKYVLPLFSSVKMSDVTKEKLYIWQDSLWTSINPRTNMHYSYNYLKKIRGYFSAFLQWYAERYGGENAFKNVKMPRRKALAPEMSIWEESEFLHFLEVIEDIKWRTFFIILFYVGCRVEEANALTDEKIGNGTVSINATVIRKTLDGTTWKIVDTKNKKRRTNKLSTAVDNQVTAYKAFKAKNGIKGEFFLGGQRPIPQITYQRTLAHYCALAGINKIRIHDFRHSYVSMLINYSASPALVADLIGDTLEQVLKTYGHLWRSERDRIIDVLNSKCALIVP